MATYKFRAIQNLITTGDNPISVKKGEIIEGTPAGGGRFIVVDDVEFPVAYFEGNGTPIKDGAAATQAPDNTGIKPQSKPADLNQPIQAAGDMGNFMLSFFNVGTFVVAGIAVGGVIGLVIAHKRKSGSMGYIGFNILGTMVGLAAGGALGAAYVKKNLNQFEKKYPNKK